MSMPVHIRSGATGAVVASLVSAFVLLVATVIATITTAAADEPTPEPTATVTVTTEPSEPTPTADPTPTETVGPTPDPSPTADPTPTTEPTPTETVEPTPTPTVDPVPPGWKVERFELADGRSYYARIPVCAPVDSAECAAYLGKKRQALFFLHGFNGLEDQTTATAFLDKFGAMRRAQNDTIFVYAVSKDGLRAWNADVCCTFDRSEGVDDVDYLVRVAADLPSRATVNSARYGVFGWSNGGMMALKTACSRPDVFDVGHSWAGTWVGPCGTTGVKVAQMHGASDTTVPVGGGRSYVAGHWFDVPPASNLARHLPRGTTFPLTVYSGLGHTPNLTIQLLQVSWSISNLRG